MNAIENAKHRLMARLVHENLDEIRASPVVMAIENGVEILVKGEEVIQEIVRSGVARSMVVQKVPSPSPEFTEALRFILADKEVRQ
jgi:hypothetical protein